MIRNLITFCKRISPRQIVKENRNLFHNKITQKLQNPSKLLVVGGSVALFSGGFYYLLNQTDWKIEHITSASCASSTPESQDSVYSPTKKHALYLTIHLHPDASVKDIIKIVGQLKKYVDIISPKDMRDEENDILAGVGFGPNFLSKIRPTKPALHNFSHHTRKGQHGSMPSTGGDIFIHAKCDELGKLFELTQMLISNLPDNCVDRFEDIYGWVYRNGRDLSGFIDGTENAAAEDDRKRVAINNVTGGSFVIAQKWAHRHNVIKREKDSTLESWIGRKRSDSVELRKKSISSHVARMTGGANVEQKKKFEILRQSQPFGTLSEESGLFFIGYSSTVEALDYMLNRMVGASEDGLSDDLMRITRCVKSTYWYFPGEKELEDMRT